MKRNVLCSLLVALSVVAICKLVLSSKTKPSPVLAVLGYPNTWSWAPCELNYMWLCEAGTKELEMREDGYYERETGDSGGGGTDDLPDYGEGGKGADQLGDSPNPISQTKDAQYIVKEVFTPGRNTDQPSAPARPNASGTHRYIATTGGDCDKFVAKKIVYDPPVSTPHYDYWPYDGVVMDFEIYDDPMRPEELATMHMPGAELATVCGVELYLNTVVDGTMEYSFEFGHIPLAGEQASEIILLYEDNWDAGGYDVLFSDHAAQSVSEVSPPTAGYVISGTYRPHCDTGGGGICHSLSDLYDFGGVVPSPHAAGVWRLHVFDLYPGIAGGVINEWQVIVYAGDGVDDDVDNCPDTYNPDQADCDGDGAGDACSLEGNDCDEDGIPDNCRIAAHPSYDCNDNGVLDKCESGDDDGDGVIDVCDVCPGVYDPEQLDFDGDQVGNACDNCPTLDNTDQLNSDSDSRGDICDNCPFVTNEDHLDSDIDFVGDACDNCTFDPNPDQLDTDADLVGDVCDNCPLLSNADQMDTDSDLLGDVCDNCPADANADQLDTDADQVGDVCDNCPFDSNTDQLDSDGDGFGDVCDNCPVLANANQLDSDSDSYGDACDNCPADANVDQLDSDGDHSGDVCDNCPTYANINQEDCDGDGVGDVCTIRDCDGSPECSDCNGNRVPDGCDIQEASPYGGAPATSTDNNGNGIPDECEGSMLKLKNPTKGDVPEVGEMDRVNQ